MAAQKAKTSAPKKGEKNKAAVKRAASNAKKPAHIQTRKKVTDPKPNRIEKSSLIKLSESQEKFIWEKAEPVSGANQTIYRRDVAGAIMKINEYGIESEFGWTFALVDTDGEGDDVNNVLAIHWKNAKVKRKIGELWIAPVTGSKDTKNIYNFYKDVKVPADAIEKLRKTTLFQDSVVGRRKINVEIRKETKK